MSVNDQSPIFKDDFSIFFISLFIFKMTCEQFIDNVKRLDDFESLQLDDKSLEEMYQRILEKEFYVCTKNTKVVSSLQSKYFDEEDRIEPR